MRATVSLGIALRVRKVLRVWTIQNPAYRQLRRADFTRASAKDDGSKNFP